MTFPVFLGGRGVRDPNFRGRFHEPTREGSFVEGKQHPFLNCLAQYDWKNHPCVVVVFEMAVDCRLSVAPLAAIVLLRDFDDHATRHEEGVSARADERGEVVLKHIGVLLEGLE